MAENGRWSILLCEAYCTYHAGEVDSALIMYLLLGEMGYEIAQSNATYIRTSVRGRFVLTIMHFGFVHNQSSCGGIHIMYVDYVFICISLC